jgi:hypothetical protein
VQDLASGTARCPRIWRTLDIGGEPTQDMKFWVAEGGWSLLLGPVGVHLRKDVRSSDEAPWGKSAKSSTLEKSASAW